MSNSPTPVWFNFASAGASGSLAWCVVHPFNTSSIRMNLATASSTPGTKSLSFFPFFIKMMKERGILSLYDGLWAGVVRQSVYATARIGLFEVFRDELAKHRKIEFPERLFTGCAAGGCAAILA